jgi:hypothetical protein
MNIIVPALAVAFAAFCVWRAVRIFNRRERWAKWTLAAIVGLPVLYVLSFGPACWKSERTGVGASALSAAYQPMLHECMNRSDAGSALHWYARVGTRGGNVGISRNQADGWLTISWRPMLQLHSRFSQLTSPLPTFRRLQTYRYPVWGSSNA